jgi:hypothetical protein
MPGERATASSSLRDFELSSQEIAEYAMSINNAIDDVDSGGTPAQYDTLLITKLQNVNSTLRAALTKATNGWRSAIGLSRSLSTKCGDLEEDYAVLQKELDRVREENESLRNRCKAMEKEGNLVLEEVAASERENVVLRNRLDSIASMEGNVEYGDIIVPAFDRIRHIITGHVDEDVVEDSAESKDIVGSIRKVEKCVVEFVGTINKEREDVLKERELLCDKIEGLQKQVEESAAADASNSRVPHQVTAFHGSSTEPVNTLPRSAPPASTDSFAAPSSSASPSHHYAQLTNNIAARITAAIAERIRIRSKQELLAIEKAVSGAIKNLKRGTVLKKKAKKTKVEQQVQSCRFAYPTGATRSAKKLKGGRRD